MQRVFDAGEEQLRAEQKEDSKQLAAMSVAEFREITN